jgi:thiamine biosynthesis protein ThiI
MQPRHILVRYGELTLKGRNRSRFEKTIMNHIKRLLKPYKDLRIRYSYGRTLIELNGTAYEPIAQQLVKVFGLSSFSPVFRTNTELQSILQTAIQVMEGLPSVPDTFKVSVRRPYKEFPHDSQEMNQLVGGHVLRKFPLLKVDVRHPQVQLSVEIRQEETYVYSEVVRGVGGLPMGSSGKAMLMLSGGIDSPVAGWMAMKRGIRVEAVHFHSFPYTSERAKQKVVDLTAKLAEFAGEVKLHMVPFTDIQIGLRDEAQSNLLITLMRRAMFRITQRLAEKNEALAIVTGENLGQVASQTLPSLYAINKVVDMPVLRPLVTMEKDEIIRLAEKIDTYSLSILPYEDCCTLFVPKNPTTNPNMNALERSEQRLTWLEERIEQAVQNTESVWVKPGNTGDVDMDELL